MTGEKYQPYVEYSQESLIGPLLPYGCGDGDGESFRYDYSSKGDKGEQRLEVKVVGENGDISYIRDGESTIYTQTTGNPVPENS